MLPASFEVDHIQPLWNGGTDDPANLVALCGNCHRDKTYKENSDRVIARRRQERLDISKEQLCILFRPKTGSYFPVQVAQNLLIKRFGTWIGVFPFQDIGLNVVENVNFPNILWHRVFKAAGVTEANGPALMDVALRDGALEELERQAALNALAAKPKAAAVKAPPTPRPKLKQQLLLRPAASQQALSARHGTLFENYRFLGSTRG